MLLSVAACSIAESACNDVSELFMLRLPASNWLIGEVAGESAILSSRLIHNTDLSLTGVTGVLNSDKSEKPKIRLSTNVMPQPTNNAAKVAKKVFQKFIIYRFKLFNAYTTAKI